MTNSDSPGCTYTKRTSTKMNLLYCSDDVMNDTRVNTFTLMVAAFFMIFSGI